MQRKEYIPEKKTEILKTMTISVFPQHLYNNAHSEIFIPLTCSCGKKSRFQANEKKPPPSYICCSGCKTVYHVCSVFEVHRAYIVVEALLECDKKDLKKIKPTMV